MVLGVRYTVEWFVDSGDSALHVWGDLMTTKSDAQLALIAAAEVDGCECGCGKPTNLAPKTSARRGWTKGKPMRFIYGHREIVNVRSRFWNKVNILGPYWQGTRCWIWTPPFNKDGYGEIKIDGKVIPAHRVAYKWIHGPVPEGLELDHLCRNPLCVRPGHLEPVTHVTNVLRGNSPAAISWRKKYGQAQAQPINQS